MKNLQNILAFTAFIILCALAFLTPKKSLETEVVDENIQTLEERQTYPVKISIESIGVNAPVEAVGVLDGAMAVPTFGQNVGWYKHGANPGEPGSAVLAGHVNWMNGETAVFTNLEKVKIGDVVSVTNNYGKIVNFKVIKIQKFSIQKDTSEIFISSDGVSRLNLITCTGEWNDILGTHRQRLVVFTERI